MNVFISWAGADRDIKNVIASKLHDEKIDYFDSDEFCKTDFSKECIENIRRSSIFIVILMFRCFIHTKSEHFSAK